MIVEDGTGLPNANNYVGLDEFEAYCDERGYSIGSNDEEQSLVRATQWLDAYYLNQFMGYKKNFRNQALEWPRVGVVDRTGMPVDPNSVPIEIRKATCEAAWRETVAPNSLAPDLERGGAITHLQAGPVAIDYGNAASPNTTFQIIDGIVAPLLGSGSKYTTMALRA